MTWAALGLGAAAALSVCVLAARRVFVARAEWRQTDAARRLRPVALALLAGEEVESEPISERDAELLAAQLARLGRSLRGRSTERIAAFFEARRWVAREIAKLRGRGAWRRATAAFALGDMGSSDAVPALLDALDDRSREVRAAAARSLGRLGVAEAVEPLVRAFAAEQIPRATVAQALLAIGPPALPAVRALALDSDARARMFAVELVGLLGNPSDGPLLVARLRDTSAEVRAKAAHALGRLGAEGGAAELLAVLDDRIYFVRAAAARALGKVGDPAAVPRLLELSRRDRFEAAQAAAWAARRLDAAAVSAAATERGAGPHLREVADLIAAGA